MRALGGHLKISAGSISEGTFYDGIAELGLSAC